MIISLFFDQFDGISNYETHKVKHEIDHNNNKKTICVMCIQFPRLFMRQ